MSIKKPFLRFERRVVVTRLVLLIKTASSESSSAFHLSDVRTGAEVKQ